jgi:hypothetical protein
MLQRPQVLVTIVMIIGFLAGCSATERVADPKAGEVGSRGVPNAQRPIKPGMQGKPGAPIQPNAQIPTFPQKFDVKGPEVDSFGFAVTQPGQITVDVQAQGAPLLVTLESSGGQPITQPAAGGLRMSHNVTPQDVQRSVFWVVHIRLAQPMPPQQGGRAAGTLNVQHPPVDQAAVRQAVQAITAQQPPHSPQEEEQAAAQAARMLEQTFLQQKTQFEQQQMQLRANLHAQIQPQLTQLRARVGGQPRPRGVEGPAGTDTATQNEPTPEVSTRALKSIGVVRESQSGRQLETLPAPPQTASSQQALAAAGSGPPPQQVMANPTISSLSVAAGQPGDPVMINGSGFGTGGEVHFVIASGKDLQTPISGVIWSDNQIFASVPDAAGVLGFNGTVYIKRTADNVKSNLLPFRFNPLNELRQITRVADATLQQINGVAAANYGNIVGRAHGNLFWSPHGNDQIYMNTRLKNGWIVSQQPFIHLPTAYATSGGAYLVESHSGTNWPHMNVGFWLRNGIYEVQHYAISIVIQGPKGVPDGVVVP